MSAKHSSSSHRIVMLLIAAFLGLVLAILIAFPEHLREYKLYLTENRPHTVLSYEEMSQEWSEEEVKKKLPTVVFRCYQNAPGQYLDERSCFADVSSHYVLGFLLRRGQAQSHDCAASLVAIPIAAKADAVGLWLAYELSTTTSERRPAYGVGDEVKKCNLHEPRSADQSALLEYGSLVEQTLLRIKRLFPAE